LKTKHALLLLLAAVLALPTAAMAQDDPPEGPTPTDDGVAVTIYNQGQAIIQDRRTLRIREGIDTIDFTDVAAQIDPTSVSFASITAPDSTIVLEQNYVYDLVGADALYRRYIDQQIRLVLSDGTELSGVLQSAAGGNVIVQRERDGAVILVSQSSVRDVTFPTLPEGLITRPTLRWTVSSATDGDQQVAITYLTGGINWTADYNLLLTPDNDLLDINGWVTLNNTSGSAYTDALVKLVAGDVNRIQPELQSRDMDGRDGLCCRCCRGRTGRNPARVLRVSTL